MKKYLIIIMSAAMLLFASGCADEKKPDAGFGGFYTSGSDAVGFYAPGGLDSFVEGYGVQVCTNPGRLTFRLQDSGQSRYVHVEFSSAPSEVSDRVTAEVTAMGVDFVGERLELEAVKVEDGKVWLSSGTVNMIIPAL